MVFVGITAQLVRVTAWVETVKEFSGFSLARAGRSPLRQKRLQSVMGLQLHQSSYGNGHGQIFPRTG